MAVHRYILHNSDIHDCRDKVLSPGQLGLLAGWGIFSTLRIADGVPFAWERHWARLSRDSKLLNVALPHTSEELRENVLRLIEANHAYNSTLRLVIVRNSGGMWEGPPVGRGSDVIALTAENNRWGDSVRLMYQPNGRFAGSDFAHAKVISWAQNLRWYERAHELGFDECILLNQHGEVTECTSANIFVVHGNQVATAPVEAGCLPGITREVLLTDVRLPGIQIVERRLRPEDLESATDVFITSTTRDLLPVSQIGDKMLTSEGTVRTGLLTRFRQYVQEYVAAHRVHSQVTR